MKRFFVLLPTVFLALLTHSAFAQSAFEAAINKATNELKAAYNLNEEQTQQVRQLQQWKYEDLQEVEVLKTSQPELYAQKQQRIARQTNGRIRRILTEQQQALFDAEQLAQKQEKETLLQQKKAEGASKAEIQQLLLELESY